MIDSLLLAISAHKLLSSMILVLVVLALKRSVAKLIKSWAKRKGQDKRNQLNTFRNLVNFILIVLLLNFWSDELQKFAFSVAAFVVAIVLATREFIQCLIGFVYLATTRPFRIGDWIEVGHYCGEVSATDWAKLTILEVDLENYDYTGKTLHLPNSQLITSSIKNLNFMKRYVSHRFTITRDMSVNTFNFVAQLEQKAREYCEHFHDVAVRYINIIEKRMDIVIQGPEPTVMVTTSNIGDTQTQFSIFCPAEQALEIEQKLTRDFMQLWFAEKQRLSVLAQATKENTSA